VFSSALSSTLGYKNPLTLPPAKSAAVILVDGLGRQNLAQRAGHAPFLSKLSAASKPIYSDFPSTTATSLTGFGTGLRAADHGIVGYAVLEQASGIVRNMLSGWGHEQDPGVWQPVETIAERAKAAGITAYFVGPPDYAFSGFTQLTMRGVTYRPARTIEDRFREAAGLLKSSGALVYVYIPELDQTAHNQGWESGAWLDRLEQVDALTRELAGALPKGAGLLLTADHGVIDVPRERQLYLDEIPGAAEHFAAVAGDPRATYIYLADSDNTEDVVEALEQHLPDGVVVVSGLELLESGVFGSRAWNSKARLPDVVVLAIGKWAVYDRRFAKPQSLNMIGQHGSLSRMEIEIPLLRMGAYEA